MQGCKDAAEMPWKLDHDSFAHNKVLEIRPSTHDSDRQLFIILSWMQIHLYIINQLLLFARQRLNNDLDCDLWLWFFVLKWTLRYNFQPITVRWLKDPSYDIHHMMYD
jgi:hypothetical protein